LQEGIELSQRWQHRDLMTYGYTIMAQVKQAQGDLPAALRMVQLAEQSLHGSQWLTSVMAALQIRLALLQGSFDVNQCQHQTDMSESPCAKALTLTHKSLSSEKDAEEMGSSTLPRIGERTVHLFLTFPSRAAFSLLSMPKSS